MPKLSDIVEGPPPGSGTSSVEVTALKSRVTALENKPAIDLTPYAKTAEIKTYDDTDIKADLKALQDAASGYALAKDLADEIARRNKLKDVRRGNTLPDFTLEWEVWIQVVEDLTASTIEVVEFARTGKAAAMPMVQRKVALQPATHTNAIALPDGVFENGLPRGVSISYKPRVDAQNNGSFTLSFAAGSLTSYQYEGLDASDTSLEVGNGNFSVTDTTLAIFPFYGNIAVVKTKWTFTYSDGQTVTYFVPVER